VEDVRNEILTLLLPGEVSFMEMSEMLKAGMVVQNNWMLLKQLWTRGTANEKNSGLVIFCRW
jgi:hypothetical protein